MSKSEIRAPFQQAEAKPAESAQGPALISIVIPVLNEEANIKPCYQAVCEVVNKIRNFSFEFVFTDNHSSDGTFELLQELAAADARVRAFRFSRNYGYQKSILTGYSLARGEATIQLDCDLQDPPEMIIEFIGEWLKGAKVVFGIRRTRQEGLIITAVRKVFYRLIESLSEVTLPPDAGDFRLVDRVILEHLKGLNDSDPYLRGSIAEAGFKQVGIPYDRRQRRLGESKFNLSALFRLAVDGITNHSIVPLRFATYTGLAISIITFLGLISYVSARLFFNVNWPAGFTTLAVLILLSLSINALFLGVLGEYVGRIYLQLKKNRSVLIEQRTPDLTQNEIAAQESPGLT